MQTTPASLMRSLEENAGRGRTVIVRQQLYTTFGNGLVDNLVHTAKRIGLEASVESGRGWFNKPHLITVKGDVDLVLEWFRIFMSVAEDLNGS